MQKTQDIDQTIFISGDLLHLVGPDGPLLQVPIDTTFFDLCNTRAVPESAPSAPRAACLLRRPVGTRFASGEKKKTVPKSSLLGFHLK